MILLRPYKFTTNLQLVHNTVNTQWDRSGILFINCWWDQASWVANTCWAYDFPANKTTQNRYIRYSLFRKKKKGETPIVASWRTTTARLLQHGHHNIIWTVAYFLRHPFRKKFQSTSDRHSPPFHCTKRNAGERRPETTFTALCRGELNDNEPAWKLVSEAALDFLAVSIR
jgi:hypothetical protein